MRLHLHRRMRVVGIGIHLEDLAGALLENTLGDLVPERDDAVCQGDVVCVHYAGGVVSQLDLRRVHRVEPAASLAHAHRAVPAVGQAEGDDVQLRVLLAVFDAVPDHFLDQTLVREAEPRAVVLLLPRAMGLQREPVGVLGGELLVVVVEVMAAWRVDAVVGRLRPGTADDAVREAVPEAPAAVAGAVLDRRRLPAHVVLRIKLEIRENRLRRQAVEAVRHPDAPYAVELRRALEVHLRHGYALPLRNHLPARPRPEVAAPKTFEEVCGRVGDSASVAANKHAPPLRLDDRRLRRYVQKRDFDVRYPVRRRLRKKRDIASAHLGKMPPDLLGERLALMRARRLRCLEVAHHCAERVVVDKHQGFTADWRGVEELRLDGKFRAVPERPWFAQRLQYVLFCGGPRRAKRGNARENNPPCSV